MDAATCRGGVTPAEETGADDSSNGLWITASGAVEDQESCFRSAPLLNED